MLLTVAVLERIKAGTVTLVFRRWRRPTVSHEIGDTLSPRGRAVLTRLQHPPTASPGPS